MAIITISRGSYFRGKEVAEKLAQKLGYACLSREILLEASAEFNIPEIKLIRAIQDAPDHFGPLFWREREIRRLYPRRPAETRAEGQCRLSRAVRHFFLQDIPHVLKVRIVGDMEARVADEVKREGISAAKAREILTRDERSAANGPSPLWRRLVGCHPL